jgi:hypothetical protein
MMFDGKYRVVYDGVLKKYIFPSTELAYKYIVEYIDYEVMTFEKDRETERKKWVVIKEDE